MTMSATPSRIRGILRAGERGFLLECPDGHVWRVESADAFSHLAGQAVVVEAYHRTPTLIDILWAGEDNQP